MRARSFKFALAGAVLCVQIGIAQNAAQPARPAAAPPARGPINRAPDPRVQQRKYHFADTNEDLPYAVFVSSKVSKDKKNPLIVALHGLGGNQNSLMRGNAVDLAEEGGYILVGPMGYNSQGWYGSPVIKGPPRGGQGNTQPDADPPNLTELSAKDVMNVLDIIRKEFNVDERRTYLMGHSMGGAGTLYLGAKYASNWAAIGAIAPAAFAMLPNAGSLLTPIKDTMPVVIAQGDADTVVPPQYARRWVDAMKQLGMNYKYVEMPGEDHGTIIAKSMPDIFAFFAAHTKQ
ncbi:MAG: prolyl oligopeptidase family serine peptidase [Acidobacteriia bacterium]|nr:prolyl oligopeptidase family serine peptidase [Terriglobia bacterium]